MSFNYPKRSREGNARVERITDLKIRDLDTKLAELIGPFFFDPYAYVMTVFPWGQVDTPLELYSGPDQWQVEVLQYIRDNLRTSKTALKIAISAGHGVGKSALFSMILKWWMETRINPRCVCTAGTKTQLQTKFWPELNIWNERSITHHWCEWQATSFKRKGDGFNGAQHRADAIPWNENNPDAFAGTHSTHFVNIDGKKVNLAGALGLFDEGSTIPDVIWETFEGALTDPGALWVTGGNPVRSSGRFFDCFGKYKETWKTWQIDARTCLMPNKEQIAEWGRDYGEDSDFFKVRVKGEFPTVASMQLIPTHLVDRAMRNRALKPDFAARVIGCDVARGGDDASAVCERVANAVLPSVINTPDGEPAKSLAIYRINDLMKLAVKFALHIDEFNPDTVFVDGVGLGAGVVDRLRQLGYRVIDVQAGASANDKLVYANLRTEMYFKLRDWFMGDVSIPLDLELREELIGLEYGFRTEKQLIIEQKKDFKKRIGRSPDKADALAITFSAPVRPRRLEELDETTYTPPPDWRVI